jgi:hypothetical protein
VQSLPPLEAPKSISLWVRYDAVPLDVENFIAFKNPLGALQVGFRNGQFAVWTKTGTLHASAPAPASGWHHVVYVWDGQRHTLYADGVPGSSFAVGPSTGTVAVARLGTHYNYPTPRNAGEYYGGQIDDVRVYDRPLSAAEVASLRAGN